MVSVDRFDFVFIKKAGTTDRFRRKQIIVAKESNDEVTVGEPTKNHAGLTPGEEVVTNASLILEQTCTRTCSRDETGVATFPTIACPNPDNRQIRLDRQGLPRR